MVVAIGAASGNNFGAIATALSSYVSIMCGSQIATRALTRLLKFGSKSHHLSSTGSKGGGRSGEFGERRCVDVVHLEVVVG
jgi:hypothetical protein